MRLFHILITSLMLAFVLPHLTRGESADYVDSYVRSVDAIKAYDVTYRLAYFTFTNNPGGNVAFYAIQTNRDFFQRGEGWRIEHYVNNDAGHSVALLDWNTLMDKVTSKTVVPPGYAFTYFLDPPIDGVFFVNLLRDKHSVILPLGSDVNVESFQLVNPQLMGYSKIVFSIDQKHGFLLQKLIYYVQNKNDQSVIETTVEVQKFNLFEPGGWFPSQIVRTLNDDGQEITVDVDRSSLNERLDSQLFSTNSMADVNYRKAGWAYDCSATQLAAFQIAARDYKVTAVPQRAAMKQFVRMGVLLIIIAPLIWLILREIRKQNTHN